MAIFSNDLLSDGHKDQVKAAWHNHFMLIVFIFSSAIEHAALLRLLNSNILQTPSIKINHTVCIIGLKKKHTLWQLRMRQHMCFFESQRLGKEGIEYYAAAARMQ